jgi:hypothetical protein
MHGTNIRNMHLVHLLVILSHTATDTWQWQSYRSKVQRKYHNHHHKHQGLNPWIRSVSRFTTALANVSLVLQLFSFLVVCSDMISKEFVFVAFFASVKASSVCIHLSCLECIQSVVHGLWSHWFCTHKECILYGTKMNITSATGGKNSENYGKVCYNTAYYEWQCSGCGHHLFIWNTCHTS